MSQYDAFDSDQSESFSKPQGSIWQIGDLDDKDNEKTILQWLNGEKNYLQEENKERFRRIEKYLALYKGIQYHSQQITERKSYSGDRTQAVEKIVCNHLFDLTQQKVSRLIKYRPGFSVLPVNDEFEDKIGSKMAKAMVQQRWYDQNFEGEIQPEFVKLVHTMGECYLAVLWDEYAGDEHPEYREQVNGQEDKKTITLKDKNGKPELGKDGKPIVVEGPVYNGDVAYDVWFTTDVLVDRKTRFEKADYLFKRTVMSVGDAKVKYPECSGMISAENGAQIYDYEKMQTRILKDSVVVWDFYHKRTPSMPNGRHITFINDKVLKNGKFPFKHKKLPVVRLTDIEMPGEMHGESYFRVIKDLTGTYNNITNMINRGQVLTAHPKWVFPTGSVKKESLGNDITLVEYKGPTPPQLAQHSPNPPELFNFREQLKEEFQQIAGVFGVSRGEPPPGIKAGVALQFLAEQENERQNEMVLKYNEWIRQVAEMTIWVASDKYEQDDQRMVQVLGKNNAWMASFFDVKHLAKPYVVRVQNASALPESKAARTQYLLDLNQQFPNQVTGEQVLDMLDMAQADKFVDSATKSVRAAEAENESLAMSNDPINDPKDYEDHITHWKIHVSQIRDWSFKNETPEEIQQKMFDHIMATEMLMVEKAKMAPEYAMAIQPLVGFPLFYKPDAFVGAGGVEPVPEAPVGDEPPPPLSPGMEIPPEMPVNIPPPPMEDQLATEPAAPQSLDSIPPSSQI